MRGASNEYPLFMFLWKNWENYPKIIIKYSLTLVLLNPDMPYLGKQCRSRSVGFFEANWSGSALFVIQYVNFINNWYLSNPIS